MRFQPSAILGLIAIGVVMGALFAPQAHAGSPSLCQTSTDQKGRLFANVFGYVSAPKKFDRIQTSVETVKVYPKVASRDGVLVNNSSAGPAELRFFNGERQIHKCMVDIIPFDLSEHSLDTITQGNCAWLLDRDLPTMTNVGQHFDVPWRFVEVSIPNIRTAKITPLSDRAVYVEGIEPGVTSILLLAEGGHVIEQCPVVVQSSASFVTDPDFDERLLCVDEKGNRARLTKGQEIYVSLEDRFNEASIANIDIARFKPLSATRVWIEGVQPGVTNLITLGNRGTLLHFCMIVVE